MPLCCHVDYCSVVQQECTKELKQKIERIQRYGKRLILSQPPCTPSNVIKHELKWISLEKQRSISHLPLLHRCLKGQVSQYLTELCGEIVTWDMYRKSFSFKAGQEWNSLPVELREISFAVVFKRHLKSLFGPVLNRCICLCLSLTFSYFYTSHCLSVLTFCMQLLLKQSSHCFCLFRLKLHCTSVNNTFYKHWISSINIYLKITPTYSTA